jgi:DNA polymerase type B, organellar and viral
MMILACFKDLFIRKYNGYKIYIHNLAKFDVIFLLKYLVKVVNVNPIIHNGRIISLKINYGKSNEYQIEFKDSLLILLRSLSELSKAFNVGNIKTIFPYLFVNKDNLNYEGVVPDFKYFGNKISPKVYCLETIDDKFIYKVKGLKHEVELTMDDLLEEMEHRVKYKIIYINNKVYIYFYILDSNSFYLIYKYKAVTIEEIIKVY